MERDGDPTAYNDNKPSLYMLGEDLKIHHIKLNEENEYECVNTFDFTKHKL